MRAKSEELRTAVADTLSAVEDVVAVASKIAWKQSDGFMPLIRSAILRRQYECLSVAVDLVDKGQGFAAVSLLRPACEEFLWAKYFEMLDAKDAEQLVLLMASRELRDSLRAQDGYAGRGVSDSLGLTRYLKSQEASSKRANDQIKALGTRLKWEKRTVQNSQLPSVSFIAKDVGETNLYRFLYHASSRYVHFSPTELLRRTWGRTGYVTVNSDHFTEYWSSFVMYWGTVLLASTFPHVIPKIDDADVELDAEKLFDAARRISAHGAIPIITAEELAWETDTH
ncbi:hypothetical protein J2X19_002110 [Rhodoferax ferrireducens]|uniref:Uncharacterized protein n=1 Tax=Rhodoferax ferrireducens TaxID=192843 RepID=A0ABU2C804_9BURK|nr:DUF5677 domain-containing protein [Rhodoferax ferrireducens]MDR7377431.1 hypothetical protein [Rhodoferax ferrireducens]